MVKLTERFFEDAYRRSHYTEITASGFANSLRRNVFNKNEIDTPNAAIGAVQKARLAAQQAKYERKHGRIIKNGATHLQSNDGEFCDKATFISEFNNETFDNRPDLAANDTATAMLNEYLRGFDNNGWLISSVDKDGYNEIINEPKLPD